MFDVVVLGTGSAGASAAFACAEAGRKVAIVDKLPFGGTCALRGCDPKKVLVGAEELVDWAQRMSPSHGITGNIAIEWPALMHFKRTITDPVPADRERSYAEAGVAAYHGAARFLEKGIVSVDNAELQAKHVVIATGAKPATFSFEGSEHLTTSDVFLNLESLPRNLVFVGGGYISFEFAHMVARAGAKATILHRGSRPLEGFDPDLVARLVRESESLGIKVHTGIEVSRIERRGDGFTVFAGAQEFEADIVVHGAGRVPDVKDLNLEATGVASGKKGIRVNEFLQSTSNPDVYAAGDAADSGGLPLTPVAGLTGDVVAQNLLHGNTRAISFDAIPSVAFTGPPLASVGYSEKAAREKFGDVTVNAEDTTEWYSSRRLRSRVAAYKVIADKAGERVLGAHILGAGAEELINLFAMAMHFQLPIAKLRDTLFAYPTFGSDLPYML